MMNPQKKPEKSMPSEKELAIAKLLQEELEYWNAELKASGNSYVVHGGLTEVLFLINTQSQINRQYLLDRYREVRDRKADCATYDLCVTSKERDQKRMEAIKRIGEKTKSIG